MPGLGNAWHLPTFPEPRGRSGMLVPEGPIVAGTYLTIINGNQFRGEGNPGDQFQDGSAALIRHTTEPTFTEVPMTFLREVGNNKYFQATWQVPETATPGESVEYYLRIRYGDHDDTYVHADAVQISATTGDEAVAQASPFRITLGSPAVTGRWGKSFDLRNVAIHTSVLPNGLVLMWGRRDAADGNLDFVDCTPFVWNPSGGPDGNGVDVGPTPVPTVDGKKINLFCAGHAFLADGRLLVVGGHVEDSVGTDTAFLYEYDPAGGVGTWTASARMDKGRWYPTATTLPDGSVLAFSGSYKIGEKPDGSPTTETNKWPQVWKDGAWIPLNPLPNGQSPDLYPRMHVRGKDGSVFMSGPFGPSWSLTLPNGGQWALGDSRDGARRDYAPSVAFAEDRIVYIGGGTDRDVRTPTKDVEVIDLRADVPWWRNGASMSTPRRQHNATILPDGTVLVTGGTQGEGDPAIESDPGFNDLRAGKPVHAAELWQPGPDPGPFPEPLDSDKLPEVGSWTRLGAEDEDRCYHSTAVLLPDARVLSAGGGEFRPKTGRGQPPNAPIDTHRTAQIFSPPYLFRGPRPQITAAPTSVTYGETFEVEVDTPDEIARVTWIRLPSVTHSMDMSQRINELDVRVANGKLRVTAPASPQTCPPGYHMLFVLNKVDVPSRAAIVAVTAPAGTVIGDPAAKPPELRVPTATPDAHIVSDTRDPLAPDALRVVVGVTGTCPYGIGACWGGADEALRHLEGVRGVDPYPDPATSTAVVHLEDGRLPRLDRWEKQFAASANGSYLLRGVEVQLSGVVRTDNGSLVIDSGRPRPPVRLAPLGSADKVQWNLEAGIPAAATDAESAAYEQLADGKIATVTGPLTATLSGYELKVRMVTTP